MLKKALKAFRRRKDLVSTKDPSMNFELTSGWTSKCMATTQHETIARIKKAKDDLNL